MSFDQTFQSIITYLDSDVFGPAGYRVPRLVSSIRNRGQKRASCNAAGWIDRATGADITEIALGPAQLSEPPRDVIVTIAHEVAHAIDLAQGTACARGRHSADWAKIMRRIGLDPVYHDSRSTRYNVGHDVIPNGLLDRALANIPPTTIFATIPKSAAGSFKRKTRYEAPCCGVLYGAPGLHIRCETHDAPFLSE